MRAYINLKFTSISPLWSLRSAITSWAVPSGGNIFSNALSSERVSMETCQGQFCLMLARCNYGYLQQRLIQQLQDECTFDIRLIHLKPDDKTLFSTVRSHLV